MATKSKKFSHSIITKTLVFILLLASVAGTIHSGLNIIEATKGNIEIIFEKSYIESSEFRSDYDLTISRLSQLVDVYKSEEYILEGKSIDPDDLVNRIENNYWEEEVDSTSESQVYNDIKQNMIDSDLGHFYSIVNNLSKEKEPLYYATNGEEVFTNTTQTTVEQFKQYPVYSISEDYDWEIYPSQLEQSYFRSGYSQSAARSTANGVKIFVGYTEPYIQRASITWNEKKAKAMDAGLYFLIFVTLFLLSLLYLLVTTGKDSFRSKTVNLSFIDKLYTDFNIALLVMLTGFFFAIMNGAFYYFIGMNAVIYITILPIIGAFGILLLSLVRHMKNKTIFKHSLVYKMLRWFFQLVADIYNSGSTGMKVITAVILYPIVTAATLYFFPITIGFAVWLVLKKVKSFQKIQDGAKEMREGNLQHQIDIDGRGEFAVLAGNINGINEGFKQAVHNELKNERMKTELITNVSHDIRTPLTSLITYTDLLKTETDPEKVQSYIEILDQKTKRLKILTDDLFDAAKATSGDIPVDLQQIDIVALINQGIGEVSENIMEKNLIFKLNQSAEKMYVTADGRLLWRSIENILSNIFNYALEGSRVYIDIVDNGNGTLISFKNISKHELNVTSEELMQRFKRGDEARSSNGSGLGLSITKSLIENQNGSFTIAIDGDLFKSMIYFPK